MSLFDNALESALARAMDPDARAKSEIASSLAENIKESVKEKRLDNAERAGKLIAQYGENSITAKMILGIVHQPQAVTAKP